MRDSIFRFSFTVGAALICFGFAYYGTHSPSLCLREEEQHKAYRSAQGQVQSARVELAAYLKKEQETLVTEKKGSVILTIDDFLGDESGTVSYNGFSMLKPEFLKLRALHEKGLQGAEEGLKDETRRKLVINRERLIVVLGSGFGVFGGLGLMVHGFFGWRRFNARLQRGK